ncbi:YbaN family protein [Marinobacter daepoensis]|uniref:YbaN family protein n=1 Tax=Marinobacter daepoensis TaxID=262077 RepID=UPI001C93CE78|nr:YbaN family protein [Marinobacter daepoensis]MBY6033230.1 YbaN family protein [Marinobacter daepoensis]
MGIQPGRTGFRILAYMSMGIAVVGVVLPLLPTTPFVILAAFFASKGSPAFALWLEQHPSFGPAIRHWRLRRAIPRKAKILAIGMMALSWSSMVWLGASAFVLSVSGLFLLGVAIYMLTRPSC